MPLSPMTTMHQRAAHRMRQLRHVTGRRRAAWTCAAVGAVTGVIAAVGIAGTRTGYLVVDPVTGHDTSATLLTLVLFLLAACLAPVTEGWRVAVRALAGAVASVLLLAVAALATLFHDFGESRYPSPDGASVLVVTEGAAMIDPLWELSVRQSSWLVARSWSFGCFNGDDPNNSLESVRWTSPTQIEATAGSGQVFVVTVDPADSRPTRSISVGCNG